MNRRTIRILICLLAVAGIWSCGRSNGEVSERLPGRWKLDLWTDWYVDGADTVTSNTDLRAGGHTVTMVFDKDGTGSFAAGNEYDFSWNLSGDTLRLDYNRFEGYSEKYVVLSIEKKIMTLDYITEETDEETGGTELRSTIRYVKEL